MRLHSCTSKQHALRGRQLCVTVRAVLLTAGFVGAVCAVGP
jgi:hypothetical protein